MHDCGLDVSRESWASCSAGVGYLQQRMSRHVIVLRLRDA
jgi:hypothetical protein